MNYTHILFAAFAAFSSVALGGPEENDIISQNRIAALKKKYGIKEHNLDSFEIMKHESESHSDSKEGDDEDDSDQTQSLNINEVATTSAHVSEDDPQNVSTGSLEYRKTPTPESMDEEPNSHDAKVAQSAMVPESKYASLKKFANNVRTALPHIFFTAAMTGLTYDEATDRDGPDASLIPLSSMAILTGVRAVDIIRRGLDTNPYLCVNVVPSNFRTALRTGLSYLPGLAYYAAYHLTASESESPISQATKACVRRCLEQE